MAQGSTATDLQSNRKWQSPDWNLSLGVSKLEHKNDCLFNASTFISGAHHLFSHEPHFWCPHFHRTGITLNLMPLYMAERGLLGPLPTTVTPGPLYSLVSADPIKIAACLTQLPAYVLWQVTTEVISTNRGDIYHEVGIPAESWLRPISLFMRVYWTVCHRWDTYRATPDNLCVYCHCFGREFFVFVLSLCNLIKSTIKIPKSLCEYVYPLKLEDLLLWNKTKQQCPCGI